MYQAKLQIANDFIETLHLCVECFEKNVYKLELGLFLFEDPFCTTWFNIQHMNLVHFYFKRVNINIFVGTTFNAI